MAESNCSGIEIYGADPERPNARERRQPGSREILCSQPDACFDFGDDRLGLWGSEEDIRAVSKQLITRKLRVDIWQMYALVGEFMPENKVLPARR